ncbi:hypothetical protein Acr_26g0000380 [Actinidia rufa]|uniref:Uncharacterized protein n=1 Tax=Actinidia rufa TaxID=165716 RepID=A0A7J0H185_9ERIC|nr:hypothetical protein Acr_26g0000380 [Actinidia rufa]
MELNRAQLLVHDDTTLDKFRTDHGIPNDVQIEGSEPNEDANLVEGISEFHSNDACGGHANVPARAFLQRLGFVEHISMSYFGRGQNSIKQQSMIRSTGELLEKLWTSWRASSSAPEFSSEELSVDLHENVVLAKDLDLDEEVTSSSSNFVSSNSSNSEEEEREKANKLVQRRRKKVIAPVAYPILVLSSDIEDFDNLAFAPLHLEGENMIEHSYSEGVITISSSREVNMAPNFRTFGQKKTQASIDPPVMPNPPVVQDPLQVQNPVLALTAPSEVEASLLEAPLLDKSKGKLALVQAIMFPNSLRKVWRRSGLAGDVAGSDLAIAVEARDASYAVAIKAQNEVVIVEAQMDKLAGKDGDEVAVVDEAMKGPEIGNAAIGVGGEGAKGFGDAGLVIPLKYWVSYFLTWDVPDSPLARMMSLPTTRKLALKNKRGLGVRLCIWGECYGASESTERSDREWARIGSCESKTSLGTTIGIKAKFESPESHRSDFGGERKPILNSDQIRSSQKMAFEHTTGFVLSRRSSSTKRIPNRSSNEPSRAKCLILTEKPFLSFLGIPDSSARSVFKDFCFHFGEVRRRRNLRALIMLSDADYAPGKSRMRNEMNRKMIGQIRQCIGHERGTTVAEQTSEFQRPQEEVKKKRPEKRSQEGGHRGQEKRRDKKNCPRNKAQDQSSEAATTTLMVVDESDVLLAASADAESDWISDSGIAYHLCRDREREEWTRKATVAQRHAKQAHEYLMDVLEESTVEQERKEMLWDTCGSLARHEKVQPVQDVHGEAQRRETESMYSDRHDVAETNGREEEKKKRRKEERDALTALSEKAAAAAKKSQMEALHGQEWKHE